MNEKNISIRSYQSPSRKLSNRSIMEKLSNRMSVEKYHKPQFRDDGNSKKRRGFFLWEAADVLNEWKRRFLSFNTLTFLTAMICTIAVVLAVWSILKFKEQSKKMKTLQDIMIDIKLNPYEKTYSHVPYAEKHSGIKIEEIIEPSTNKTSSEEKPMKSFIHNHELVDPVKFINNQGTILNSLENHKQVMDAKTDEEIRKIQAEVSRLLNPAPIMTKTFSDQLEKQTYDELKNIQETSEIMIKRDLDNIVELRKQTEQIIKNVNDSRIHDKKHENTDDNNNSNNDDDDDDDDDLLRDLSLYISTTDKSDMFALQTDLGVSLQ